MYANWILEQQHVPGKTWDRYAPIASRHWATHEAVFGQRDESAKIALSGIWRAVRAQQEDAPAPEASPFKNIASHAKFVGKQVLANTAALALAVTKPHTENSRWAKKHCAIARKMLG